MSISPSISTSIGQSITTSLGSLPRAIFSANLQSSLIPEIANGDPTPTFSRATTATVQDFNGIIHTALSGEPRFKGARRVENLITASEDMTNGAYSDAQNAVSTATQTTYDGTINGTVQQITTITDDGGGTGSRTFVFSVKIKLISGTPSSDAALDIRISGSAVSTTTASIGNDVTSVAKRFSVSTSTDAAGAGVTPAVVWDDAGVLEITEWQLEETTGNTDTTLPGDYVSSGVLSAPFHGANVDGVQYFITKNGNTVTDNIVTENVGAAIGASDSFADAKGPFGYMSEAAAINLAIHSNTWENAAWVASNVTKADNDAVSPTGSNTAASLTATAANGTVIQDLGTISSAEHIAGLWIKRKTGTGDIQLTIDNGTTWTTVAVTSEWVRFSSPSKTAADPDIGIRIVTSGDAVNVYNGQAETGSFSTSDTVTEATAVTRNADVLTYDDVGNIKDVAGTMFAEASTDWAVSSSSSTAIGRSIVLLFGGSAQSATRIRSNDGTNISIAPVGTSMQNTPQKIATVWGSELTAYSPALLIPDTTPESYDGSMGSGNIAIGANNLGSFQLSGTVRNVQIFNRQFNDAEVLGHQ